MLIRSAPSDLTIRPRAEWAGDLVPVGPLELEPDVRILVVHHSESPNGYAIDDVARTLQGFFSYHTGPEKGWSDIAYNFLIDRFGQVWEGREGSLDGAVRGSATGGNQGFSQLCCFIGSHQTELPTPEAMRSMTRLLAWLADRHGISTTAGSRATFTSLGSNRWPEGAAVDLPTIVGHRQVSQTACPGDAVFAWVAGSMMAEVDSTRTVDPAGSAETDAQPDDDAPASTSTAAEGDTSPSEPVVEQSTTSDVAQADSTTTVGSPTAPSASSGSASDGASWLPIAGGCSVAVAAIAAVIQVRRRRI